MSNAARSRKSGVFSPDENNTADYLDHAAGQASDEKKVKKNETDRLTLL
jgi:hypothetical protein